MNDTYQSQARGAARPAQPRQAIPRQSMPPTNEPRLTRRRRTTNPLEFDQSIIPPGLSYEWKRESTFAQPDREHQIALRENHWTPVPADRHPELAPEGETVIRRGGELLMQRPKYLTEEAQMEDIQEALRPIAVTEEKLYGTPDGQFTRDHPSVRKVAGITQQWAPGSPIEESLTSEP